MRSFEGFKEAGMMTLHRGKRRAGGSSTFNVNRRPCSRVYGRDDGNIPWFVAER
jgi:hypothetical protein